MLTLLLCTVDLFWKYIYLFLQDRIYSSHYYYIQQTYSENVLNNSLETVHTAHFTIMCGWVFLEILLVFLTRHYILLKLPLCTAEVSWKCSDLFWGHSTYSLYYYYLQLSFSENIHILRRQYIMLTLLIRTAVFFWKCSYLFRADCTLCSLYYYVEMRFSENVLIYTEYSVHTAYITTRYRWIFLKMILVIPGRQYIMLTLLLCTDEFFWKWSYIFPREVTYCLRYY